MSQQKLVSQNGYNGHSKSPSPGSRPTTPSSKLVGSRANSRSNSRLDHEDSDHWITISSKFHFVDLAGSERVNFIISIFILIRIHFFLYHSILI